MAPRTNPRSKRPATGRVAALEKRVEELTARLEKAERAATRLRTLAGRIGSARGPAGAGSLAAPRDAPPGLRRRAPRARTAKPAGEGVRCPGCTLVALGTRDRCGWCGFLFAVLPPSRRPGGGARKAGGRGGDRKRPHSP